jgi:hypothetical protein
MARPIVHAVVSGAIGLILWRRTRSLASLGAPILGGFLIDADHLVDYAVHRLRPGRGLSFLPLHGWELVPLFWKIERRFVGASHGGFTFGYLAHLSIDQVTNEKRSPFVYFLAYRAKKRFASNLLGAQSPDAPSWHRSSLGELWRWFL